MAARRAMRPGLAFELVEWAEHQLVAVVAAFDPGVRVVRQVGGNLTLGAVEPDAQVAYFCSASCDRSSERQTVRRAAFQASPLSSRTGKRQSL